MGTTGPTGQTLVHSGAQLRGNEVRTMVFWQNCNRTAQMQPVRGGLRRIAITLSTATNPQRSAQPVQRLALEDAHHDAQSQLQVVHVALDDMEDLHDSRQRRLLPLRHTASFTAAFRVCCSTFPGCLAAARRTLPCADFAATCGGAAADLLALLRRRQNSCWQRRKGFPAFCFLQGSLSDESDCRLAADGP